jgi:uncharacterized protein DUF262
MSRSDWQEFGVPRGKDMSQEELEPSSPTHSVQDLVSRYDLIGIPHFQRGLVWSQENTALLLESLYFGTPCGTIVLWEPSKPDEEGVPLLEVDKEGVRPSDGPKLRYLIVDGQQRIRSLLEVLGAFIKPPVCKAGYEGPASEDEGDSDNTERGRPRVWCLNLSRIPKLDGFFGADMARYPMFRLMADPDPTKTKLDPTKPREDARRRYNLIPLRFFFDGQETDVHDRIRDLIRPLKSSTATDDVCRRIKDIELGRCVRKVLTNKVFFLQVVKQQPQEKYCLADVVSLYNRINSAGKRVETRGRPAIWDATRC